MENYVVHCDGASRGNPGPAAAGFVVLKNGKEFVRVGKSIGEVTNNVAEYTAVLAALSWFIEKRLIEKPLTFVLDSQLVVNQLQGIYKIKNKKLMVLAAQIKSLEKKFTGLVVYKNVARENNTIADAVVNQILDDSEKSNV